jgi:hypothetical protein
MNEWMNEWIYIYASIFLLAVFPEGVPVISLEAASKEGWAKYSHYQLGLDYFGKSAPIEDLYEYFGFTGPKVAAKAKGLIAHFEGKTVPFLMDLPQLDWVEIDGGICADGCLGWVRRSVKPAE